MKKIFKKALLKIPKIKKHYDLIDDLNTKNCNLNEKNQILINHNLSLKEENKNLKQKFFDLNQIRYKYIISKIKEKVKKGVKLRVCFFVMMDSSFAARPIYEKMLTNTIFDPFIVVIPDISRSKDHLLFTYKQAYSSLSKKYKNVYKGYDVKTKKCIDFSKKIDILYFPFPYSKMSFPLFEIEHFLDKNILTFHVNYSFSITKFSREVFQSDFYNLVWKIFIPTNYHLKEIKKYQYLKSKNILVTGYSKMDDLRKQKIKIRKRKTIIIAPHHTILDWKLLKISNFLKYANFFIELPKLYPQIDFIFRPHPLLIVQLKKPEIWGEEKTIKYFQKMESYQNIKYSNGGEYFDIFINSDGIIHDCGSFLAEYLFTEKPACYMLKNKKSIKKWFLPIGQKCLDHCYQAYSKRNIINFIENVILNNKDPLKKDRLNFVNSELKINYPNVSQVIINHIKKEILN